ncbi:MAG: hypothetical protein RIB93_13910 [Coleofasciculus sp. D1-CHI-01]|uniref:hypothetical protein n=1 Tax=Coleofasciculus sp. D1-CHI-01 TaxID=3068482 RepID=UPI0032F833BC
MLFSIGVDGGDGVNTYLIKQSQPRGNHQVNWLEFLGKDKLQMIETICGTRMQSFGYHLSPSPITFDVKSDKVPHFPGFTAAFV